MTGVEKLKRDRDYGLVLVVIGGVRRVRYLSVSQLQAFSPTQDGGCNRRWFFRRVLGKPEPTTKSQAEGTDGHEQIKVYLQTGRDNLGPIVRAGRHFIPEPGPDLVVERDFCSPTIVDANPMCLRDQFLAGGVPAAVYQAVLRSHAALTVCTGDDEIPLVGASDLIHRRDHYITTEGARVAMPRNSVEVVDWKTSGDIAKWAKAPEALVETIQMPGYAELASRIWPDLEWFRVSHGYFQTGRSGRRADKRSAIFDLTVKRRRWYEVENTARALTQVAREDDVEKVEANRAACSSFGGCPHWEYCPRSPAQTIVDLFRRPDFAPRRREKENQMGMLEKMGSQANGQPQAAPFAPPQGQPFGQPQAQSFGQPQAQPPAFGQPPQFAPQAQQAFAPQAAPFAPPQGQQPQPFAPPQGQQAQPFAPPQGQQAPSSALQDEVKRALADERRIMQERGMAQGQPQAFAAPQGQPQPSFAPQGQPQAFAPQGQPSFALQGQPQAFAAPQQAQPQAFAPQQPQAAPFAPQQAQPQAFAPQGQPQPSFAPQGQPTPAFQPQPSFAPQQQAVPESIAIQSPNGPICAACGASLTRENVSRLPDGKVLHVQCPRRAAPAALPPDAPQSGQFQPAAQPVDPMALAAMPPPIQQAHQAVLGAMQAPAAAPRASSRSGKCGGSGQTVYLQPPEIMAKRATCSQCGTQNLAVKPEMLGDKAIAKVPSHPDPRAVLQAPQALQSPQAQSAAPAGIDLYVDCVVSGAQQVLSLDAHVDNLARQIEQHFQVPDIRSVQGDGHPLSFGKWKGVLAALARESAPPPGAYTLTHVAESEVKQIVVDALRPFCKTFVRSIR